MSLSAARARLVRHLRALRLPDGSFTALIAPDERLASGGQSCRSNFFLALTLSALHASEMGDAERIRDGLATALRAEMGERGTFNYWMRSEPLRASRPYPDDLDTTACALAALSAGEHEAVRGALLGNAVRALTSVETQEGGPYRTWLMPPNADAVWQDVDVAVNANIAWYLSQNGIRLESLDAWLYERIRAGAYASPYYPSSIPILYFLARGYVGPLRDKIRTDIVSARLDDGTWGNVTQTALAVAALAALDAPAELVAQGRERIAERIMETDAAPVDAFCIDSITSGQPFYAGSAALTCAICLEALGPAVSAPLAAATVTAVPGEDRAFRAVMDLVRERIRHLPDPLGPRVREWSDRIVSGVRGREIPLLPFRFHASLAAPVVSSDRLILLGAASVYGWIAYTIYDDLLDQEGDVRDLPVANACLRMVDRAYADIARECVPVAQLQEYVMDRIDCANGWETIHARLELREGVWIPPRDLPDYGDLSLLADRSFGHALGPLAVLLLAGHDRSSRELQELSTFFHHTLIARQLDDDAHDWEEDLLAGRVNAVAALMLRAWRARGRRLETLLPDDVTTLREFFWQKMIEDVVALMLEHVHAAEACVGRMTSLRDQTVLLDLLRPMQSSAERARSGARGTQAFLSSYIVRSGDDPPLPATGS